MAGTSATLLARKWESAMLVNVDNDTLRRILDNPEATAAVERIEGWRSLGDNIIETIINQLDQHRAHIPAQGGAVPVRRTILPDARTTQLGAAPGAAPYSEFETIRQSLLKIGARVIEKAARIRIHWASACLNAALFRMLARRLVTSGHDHRGNVPQEP